MVSAQRKVRPLFLSNSEGNAPRCNKFSSITLLDCTDSPLLPFSHRISDVPNQVESKFYTLASLKYCDAMVIGCKDSGGRPAIGIL